LVVLLNTGLLILTNLLEKININRWIITKRFLLEDLQEIPL